MVALVGAAIVLTCIAFWSPDQAANAGDTHARPVPSSLATATLPLAQATPSVTEGSSSPAATTQQPAPSVTTVPPPTDIVMPIKPVQIFIPVIGVNTSISAAPSRLEYDPHLGVKVPMYGTPKDLTTVTWWSADHNGTPAPRPGDGPVVNTMIAEFFGHTGINGAQGVFDHLGNLQVGQTIGIQGENDAGQTVLLTVSVLRVVSGLDKADANALNNSISTAPAATRMTFITCSGDVNERIASSNFNTEVDAGNMTVQVLG
jgi:hypothetical protein